MDSPDKEGRTALMCAAERGHYNVVKTMIERSVDIKGRDNQGMTGGRGSWRERGRGRGKLVRTNSLLCSTIL